MDGRSSRLSHVTLVQRRSPAGVPRGVPLAAGWVVAAVIPIAFLGVFFAWPVITLIGRGFVDENGFTLAGFAEAFGAARTLRIIGQTLALAVTGTLASVALGVPGAYVLYRCRFPGRTWLRALVSVPFVLPTVVVGVAFKTLFNGPLAFLGIGESFGAIVLALVFFNYSVIVRTVGAMWARLDPRVVEAARALGATPARALWTVTLPALAPAIASGAALVFLFCASAFGIVMIMGGVTWGTLETEIYYQTAQLLNLPVAAALSIVQLTVVSASLGLANATRTRRERALRLRTDGVAAPALRWSDWPAVVPTLAVVVGVIGLPLAALVTRSLATPEGWGLHNYQLLGIAGSAGVSVWAAAATSLATATQAALLAVTLGLMVSFVLSRRPRTALGQRAQQVLDSLFMLPLGVSAVTVGFGFLVTLNRPPLDLRSSTILIPVAQAVVALPLVVRTLLPVLRALDPRQLEAAATLGAGPWRVAATIEGPYALRGLGLALGFAFATSLGEFGATSFLARPDTPTLPVLIFHLIGRPGADNQGMALAACVMLALVTGTVMAAAETLGHGEARGW